MKTFIITMGISALAFSGFNHFSSEEKIDKFCVFRTIFNEDPVDTDPVSVDLDQVFNSTQKGLKWLRNAQQENGGWGAGSHSRQGIKDPHAVPADPATTAMVAMAILRTDSDIDQGLYAKELRNATQFLLKATEEAKTDGSNLTQLTNTQIQRKLGANIDLILTSQFFSNLLEAIDENYNLHPRVIDALNKCVEKIQLNQDENGSFKGAGWAGVLQSSLANNALESAQYSGAEINEIVLDKSRAYQKSNYDVNSSTIKTTDGAGVMLYSVSGSVRASAKEARKSASAIKDAIMQGSLEEDAEVNAENLVKVGYSQDQAMKLYSSYQVYESAKRKAQQDEIMKGFGNNGGEEFLSYLQTGESLIINQDQQWETWYENVAERLLKIQNNDGSWNGHHCITSPVFCTATCIMILSIQNDIDQLAAQGE
jgi:hypothetical protein